MVVVLTISSGHSASYLTDQVATGRENYYTGAVAAGEPPGRWYGAGADALGLTGLVDSQDMTGLFEYMLDPRDEHFRDPSNWADASTLGHAGRAYKSQEQLYSAALDAEPDASPERRAELWLDAGKRTQTNVAFLDATFSVQKSITVLHAAFEAQQVRAAKAAETATDAQTRTRWETVAASWGAHKQAVENAIWSGNHAGLGYLAEHAGYSRVGHHGGAAGRYIDAHNWTVASFFQHDSRNHDPQLHIHNAILNRVQGADGVWRTLDGRGLYAHRGAAAAVAERTTEEHLARALGVRFATRPDGKAREIVGVEQRVMDLFSTRRRAITKRTTTLVAAFEEKFGREPNALELDRLQRQATMATRNAKTHDGETVEQRLERWDRQLRAEVAGGLAEVANTALGAGGDEQAPTAFSRQAVIETALADVQSRKAAWTPADLTRAISDALPDHLGNLSGAAITSLLDGLTQDALTHEQAVPLETARPGQDTLPADLRLANGQSAYQAPGRQRFATAGHVHSEKTLVQATARGGAPAVARETAQQFVTMLAGSGIALSADQAAAVRGILTSGATVESLVGPAGTGKSFVVGALARAWQDPNVWDGQQRRVVGLAASQIATDVLAGEDVAARNITRWLATQQRLAEARATSEDAQWRLRAGDLVVIDESAMANTADLARIHAHVAGAGAKLLLTGDHKQLAAVGAGGGMQMMAEAGARYELAEARRFRADWERAASLRLRAGDQGALGEYHKHGRLIGAGTLEQAEQRASRAWLADTLAGKHSLLIVDTNERAASLAAQIRRELVRLGKVSEQGVALEAQGTYAGVGDLVQARRNAWDLAGYRGNQRGPINREQYRVEQVTDNGELLVRPVLGHDTEGAEQHGAQLRLPADYVRQHMALGYASTVNSAQGMTVDTCHTVTTSGTNAAALYVGMSRGRESNTAYVNTVTPYTRMGERSGAGLAVPAETGDATIVGDQVSRSAQAVLAGILEGAESSQSALATAMESATEMGSVRTPAELLADAVDVATADRTARWLDELVDAGSLSDLDRVRIAAEDGTAGLGRLLRRVELAGHDPRQVLTDAVVDRTLEGSRQLTNVIHHRIASAVDLDPRGTTYREWTPQVEDPAWQDYLNTLADAADARRDQLGQQAAAQPPQWALEAFGPVPDEAAERSAWEAKAGAVAAHRELVGFEDPAAALGPAPKAGQVEAYASWRTAWHALDRPDAQRAEVEMSDGQLRVRVRAYQREESWAPRYVANELAGTREAATTHRQTAAMRAAEAATAQGTEREQLLREAAEARALADALTERVTELEVVDQARAQWLARSAETRAARDRAEAELSQRDASRDRAEDIPVTAEEWLAEHNASQQVEDPHRQITDEVDLADIAEQRHADEDSADTANGRSAEDNGTAEATLPQPDIREIAATEPRQRDEDSVRVPSADESADYTAHARRAINEFAERDAVEELHAAEEARAKQLNRWHADDVAREAETAVFDELGADHG